MSTQLRSFVRQVIDEVLGALPQGSAVLREEQSGDSELVVTVQPQASAASPVTVTLLDDAPDSVFVEVGEASTVELSTPNETGLGDQLRAGLTAVTRQRLTERTWRHQGSILKSEARIQSEGGELGPFTAQFGLARLIPSAEVADRRFSPYECSATDQPS